MLFTSQQTEPVASELLPRDPGRQHATDTSGAPACTLSKRETRCRDALGELGPGVNRHIVSFGEWSAHDLLLQCLRYTGPARVLYATWSVTQIGADAICNALHDGLITDMAGLIDWRLNTRKAAEVAQLVHAGIGVYPASCHAKVFVATGPRGAACCLGSANFTNNPRIEASAISTDTSTCDFHARWIGETLAGLDPLNLET